MYIDNDKITHICRRRIIVVDYDFGREVRHEFILLKSNRIDCYRISVEGKLLNGRYGWSSVLELVRKTFIRVGSFLEY